MTLSKRHTYMISRGMALSFQLCQLAIFLIEALTSIRLIFQRWPITDKQAYCGLASDAELPGYKR